MSSQRFFFILFILIALVFCWSNTSVVPALRWGKRSYARLWGFNSSAWGSYTPRSLPANRGLDHFSGSSSNLRQTIISQAASNSLDPDLVHAIIWVESGYNPQAVSRTGATGLMQLMPGTAREVGVRDSFNPHQNVAGGSRYLKAMLDRFNGNLPLALAAYNAGPAAVEKYGGIPPIPETRAYVQNVLRAYQFFKGA